MQGEPPPITCQYDLSMQAHGADGMIAANDSHVTIVWKTLRGRLTSLDGSNMEIIPIARIFDVVLIPATENMKGCFHLNLIGSENPLVFEENWMSSLRKSSLNHAVLFNLPSQFEFNALTNHVLDQIKYLRRTHPLESLYGMHSRSHG